MNTLNKMVLAAACLLPAAGCGNKADKTPALADEGKQYLERRVQEEKAAPKAEHKEDPIDVFVKTVLSYFNKDNMPEKLKGVSPELQKLYILYRTSSHVLENDPGVGVSISGHSLFDQFSHESGGRYPSFLLFAYLAQSAGVESRLIEASPKPGTDTVLGAYLAHIGASPKPGKEDAKPLDLFLALYSGYAPAQLEQARQALKKCGLVEHEYLEIKSYDNRLFYVTSNLGWWGSSPNLSDRENAGEHVIRECPLEDCLRASGIQKTFENLFSRIENIPSKKEIEAVLDYYFRHTIEWEKGKEEEDAFIKELFKKKDDDY